MLNKYCEKLYTATQRRQNVAPNLDCGGVDFTDYKTEYLKLKSGH